MRALLAVAAMSLIVAACTGEAADESQVTSSESGEQAEADEADTDEAPEATASEVAETAKEAEVDGEDATTDAYADADADAGQSSDDSVSDEPEADEETATPTGPPRSVFPDVEVVEIASGQSLNVADALADSGKATLLWFFAPH